jgi:hypothetical protein
MVWVPVVRDDHSAVLYGNSYYGRLVTIADLPAARYIGIFTRAAVDSRGRVWVSGDHLIVRYDPVATRTTSVTFPRRVPRGEPRRVL